MDALLTKENIHYRDLTRELAEKYDITVQHATRLHKGQYWEHLQSMQN